jgi:hydroxyethylthiazole kinase-like uncharacterized protein yjeF
VRLDLPGSWPPEYPLHVPISAQTARSLDARAAEDFGIPSLVLMEHAARGVAAVVAQLPAPGAAIQVLCGPGNNGGDGYGVARFLSSCGRRVQTWRCAPETPSAGDAGHEFALLQRAEDIHDAYGAPETLLAALSAPSLVIDALFGVGLTRPLAAPYRDWIEALNASQSLCVAIDLPSGMDSDTGEGLPLCVRADVTATMAAPKLGLLRNPAAAGQIIEIDIGLPRTVHGPYLAETGP